MEIKAIILLSSDYHLRIIAAISLTDPPPVVMMDDAYNDVIHEYK